MENTEKKQIFYFDDKDNLIIESSRGFYVNGDAQHRIVGDFNCNARTMSIILAKHTESPIKVVEKDGYIVIAGTEFEQQLNDHAKKVEKSVDALIESANKTSELTADLQALKYRINQYNSKSWLYRIFHKIALK